LTSIHPDPASSEIRCDTGTSAFVKRIEQRVIDASIDKWHARLKACLRADAGYFEHML